MLILMIWLIQRLVTWLYALWVSSFRPFTEIERTVSIWPISSSFNLWLERVLLHPWLRWDAEWYLRILNQGYHADDGTAQFHPLYPWLSSILFKMGFHPLFSLLVVSSISSLCLLFFFVKLTRLDFSSRESFTSLLLFVNFPAAFILFAPYTEALFLLFAVLSFYFVRKHRWWLSGFFGGLAVLTRQQGIFLVFPLIYEYWEVAKQNRRYIKDYFREGLSFCLLPTALSFWFLYRFVELSDLHPKLKDLNSFIYSLVISPSSSQVVPDQAFIWPWRALSIALVQVQQKPDLDLVVNLLVGAFFLLLLIIAWKKLRTSYRLYSILIILVSFGYYTGPIHPYMGLPRHLYLAFPVFIGLGSVVTKPGLRLILLAICITGFLLLETFYILRAWVP